MKAINWFKSNYWLVGILVVAAGLRFYRADFQSLWLDEVLSMNDANPKLNFKQFYDSVIFWEDLPHLYFFLLKIWVAVFGFTSMAARIFSAFIGIAGVYSMYLLGKELMGKSTGLLAAGLTAVNVFHLFYSQEVRPYGMFFLFTVLAFYRLSIFLKNPTYKNAVLFGFFSGLIFNAHFIGLTAIFAQCVLLLFFLIASPKTQRLQLFLRMAVAGVVILVTMLPAYEPFAQLAEIKSFWIAKPGENAVSLMFTEFFNHAELLIFVVSAVAIYFFVSLFTQKLSGYSLRGIMTNPITYSAILLFVWIIASLLIPMIKSYTDVSVMLTRYFINILPVILLVVAIGISCMRNRLVQVCTITAIAVFSLLDLFIVKDYYNTPTKTQYREITAQIAAKNADGSKIVAFWSWIFPHFFPEDNRLKFEQAQNLEEYVNKLKSGSAPERAFWYADANGRPLQLSADANAYLSEKFILKEKLDYLDVWANYYVPKKDAAADSADISKFKGMKPANGDSLNFTLEVYEQKDNRLKTAGWAYFKDQEATGTSITLVLMNDQNTIPLQTDMNVRSDVTTYFKSKFNIDNSGFSADTDLSNVPAGKYELGVYAVNSQTKKEALTLTGKFIQK